MLFPYRDKLMTNWNCCPPPTLGERKEREREKKIYDPDNLHQNSYLSNNHQYISFAAVKR